MDNSESSRPTKRKRLNFACNYCRSRKVRCDQQEPSCQGCLIAGVECTTTDKRRPGLEVRRRPAGSQDQEARPSSSRQVELLPAVAPARSVQRGTVPITPASDRATNRSPSVVAPDNPGSTVDSSGRLPMAPRISGADTLEIMTGWLELAFHRLAIRSSFDSCLRAKAQAPSPPLGIPVALPRLPPPAQCREALATYYATVHVLYPILDPHVLNRICEDVVNSCSTGMVQAERLPEFLLFCLALVLGSAGNLAVESWDLATSYIGFCETMLGHVLGWGTIDAVRVVFLLALALRWREKITSAWPLAGVCVSIAQVLGLDRQKPYGRRSPEFVNEEVDQERRRVWWCVYSFEKLFAFELGRPSTISDVDHDQLEPDQLPLRGGNDTDFFHIVISLARTLSEVSKRSIAARTQEELAGREGLENAIRFKVATTGELVLLLMQWAESLPKHLRPTSDLLCEPDEFPLAAFISVQYHSAMIMVLRNTLLVSDEAIRTAVEEYAAGKPWSHVTRNPQTIVANSARRIVRLFMEGHDLGFRPVLYTVTAPLHVLSVLSVHLIRHPASRVASSDLSLIHNAGDFAVENTSGSPRTKRVHGIVQLLDQEVVRIVAAAQPRVTARSSITGPSLHIDHSPHLSHPADGDRDAAAALEQPFPQAFNHNQGGLSTDLLDLPTEMSMSMPIPDVAWSPALADEIGWDWGDFSQLFAEPPI